jgi:ppGpp synthetase/RelA/SpoT-type nucleotidyltranferase
MNEVNELFTKENVEKIYVPDIVKDDLLSIIEEKLKKAGFYYRVAYRVKAPDSMLDKLILKDYRRPGTENQDKKMQDLIGIRIILYYADDVEIVKNFLDTLFSLISETSFLLYALQPFSFQYFLFSTLITSNVVWNISVL